MPTHIQTKIYVKMGSWIKFISVIQKFFFWHFLALHTNVKTYPLKLFWLLKLIKGPNRLKFRMKLPSNWVSIANHSACINGCGLVIATPIGQYYAWQKFIYGLIRLKLGIWSPSKIINCMWVWFCISHTHRGSCFGWQNLIEGPTRPKLEWLL